MRIESVIFQEKAVREYEYINQGCPMNSSLKIIDQLEEKRDLSRPQWMELLSMMDDNSRHYAAQKARKIADAHYEKNIYIRGLIEFSNICRNNCFYCGIRASNTSVERYRLTQEDVLACCDEGYGYGFRTFVLQSGEDLSFSSEQVCHIVRAIKTAHPDCAVTLSIGERSPSEYEAFFRAGADRYLLRHETASEVHYQKLHPPQMSWKARMQCLRELKRIGFQTGCGMMVGSPFQTLENLAMDLEFIREFQPEMVGIGPFLPHCDTPFRHAPKGSYELTLFLLSLVRIMVPDVLLPATTALGTIHPFGREAGILAGANVVMPNLSPVAVRQKYQLYDNKLSTGEESAQCMNELTKRLHSIGYAPAIARGDCIRERSFI